MEMKDYIEGCYGKFDIDFVCKNINDIMIKQHFHQIYSFYKQRKNNKEVKIHNFSKNKLYESYYKINDLDNIKIIVVDELVHKEEEGSEIHLIDPGVN